MNHETSTPKKTRTRRTALPPLPVNAEGLAEALFELPERHIWAFMKGNHLGTKTWLLGDSERVWSLSCE